MKLITREHAVNEATGTCRPSCSTMNPENTGSKAGTQNYALKQVKIQYTLAIDAE